MLMKEIKEDMLLCKFDGVSTSTVYCGGLSELKRALLFWRKADEEWCEAMQMDVFVLNLSEVVKQLGNERIITVINESPTHGEILQYGNYGDSWWQIGETCGYA